MRVGNLCGLVLFLLVTALVTVSGAETAASRPTAKAPCAKPTLKTVGPFVASGCWQRQSGVWSSTRWARVNGIELTGPGQVVLNPKTSVLRTTAPMRLTMGKVVLAPRLSLHVRGGREFRLGVRGTIRGLLVRGQASLRFGAQEGGATTLRATVELPVPGRFTGTATLRASRRKGFDVRRVRVDAGGLRVGRFGLQNLRLMYVRQGAKDVWAGDAKLALPAFAAPVRAVDGSFRVVDGKLSRIGVQVDTKIPIGGGFVLTELGARIGLDPFAVSGNAGGYLGPLDVIHVRGALTYAEDPRRWQANGSLTLTRAIDGVSPSLRGAATLFASGHIELDASLTLTAGRYGLRAQADGFVSRRAFNIEGDASLSVPGPDLHGEGLVSSRGAAGCGKVFLSSRRIGFGARWDGDIDFIGGSCDVGPWRAVPSALRTAPRSTAAATTIVVPPGIPMIAIAAQGNLTSMSPTTSEGSVTTRGDANGPRSYVAHEADTNTVYVVIDRPAPGAWVLNSLGPLNNVRIAEGLPDPEVDAVASGTGATRTLTYTFTPLPGQTVSFYEGIDGGRPGADPIVEDVVVSGNAEFVPQPLGPGTRHIWALVSQDGKPRSLTRVATFVAAESPLLGPPEGASLTRTSAGLRVDWAGPANAPNWIADIVGTDGRVTARTLRADARSLSFPVAAGQSARITMTGVDEWGREGVPTVCGPMLGPCASEKG